MGREFAHASVLGEWVERDLSQAAAAGELCRAFEVEEQLHRLNEAIRSGRRPVLAGPSGVGKTALVHELVCRDARGLATALGGRRVVQISLRTRAASLAKAGQVASEFQKLSKALDMTPDVIPFFRDFHLVDAYGLAAPMAQLAMHRRGPIVAEGEGSAIQALFEQEPDIEAEFAHFPIGAPSERQLERIVRAWADDDRHPEFDDAAIESAIFLSDRFLIRRGQPRAVLEVLDGVTVPTGCRGSERDVVSRLVEGFEIPRLFVDTACAFDPAALEERLRATVVEQDAAVGAAVRMMVRVRAGVADPRRALGAFLLVGPSGVGKTLIAQALAAELFGSPERLVRINMADYPEEWDDHDLFGNANAHTLAGRRGVLTTRLQSHAVAVLLLDEFEKAHPHVHDRFLQFVDEGTFINGAGETVSCRSLVVIATSNAGAEVYRESPAGFEAFGADAVRREVRRRVGRQFRFELLNRFDDVVYFDPLSPEGVRRIARRELEALANRSGLRRRGIRLEVDDGVVEWVSEAGYDARFGARYLRRAIERHLATAVAEVLVKDEAEDLSRIVLTMTAGKVVARSGTSRPMVAPAAGA